MRLLLGSKDPSRLFHWNEFGMTLSRIGVECKVVNNTEIADGFPTKKVHKWVQPMRWRRFNRLISSFSPDAIMTDGLRHFGIAALKSGIPLILYLVGDFWTEIMSAKETKYSSFPRSLAISRLERMANEILHGSRIVMPISEHLNGIVRENLPGKPTYVLRHAMDPSVWHHEKGMTLKHPCVGIIQNAVIWNKAKEMLVLKDVLEGMPHVMFYWAGGGPYTKEILDGLGDHPNFKYLGALDYPGRVRQFLSEIDIYTLFTGMDMAPTSVKEALLMEKPSVITNVGGVPEIVEDGRSGMLVNAGDPGGIVGKISYLLENPEAAVQMGRNGRKAVTRNADGRIIAKGFVEYLKTELNLH